MKQLFKQTLGNPFYALLVIAAVAFSVTACAYGVMIVRGLHASRLPLEHTSPQGQALMSWLDQHGFSLMLGELTVLAVCCFLAIGTDKYWNPDESNSVQRD